MKKILVVDDQQQVRELITVTLWNDNYKIIQAGSGEEAIKTAREEMPELIIMDVMMPGKIDGLEATRSIKNDQSTRKCKVIMLTAKGQDMDIEEGYKAGAEDYFVKPFSPLDLIKKIEEALVD